MNQLSDCNIDSIIKKLESILTQTKNSKTILEQMKIFLKNNQSGFKENVCHRCLGTGYEDSIEAKINNCNDSTELNIQFEIARLNHDHHLQHLLSKRLTELYLLRNKETNKC